MRVGDSAAWRTLITFSWLTRRAWSWPRHPVSLVVLPGPKVPIGATALRVSVAGYDSGMIPVSAVLLEFSGPPDAPDAGTQGKVILTNPWSDARVLSVEVRNGSPEIIQLPHGNVQRLETSGGDENIAPVELKFLAAGNYTLTARLIPGSPASAVWNELSTSANERLPDISSARAVIEFRHRESQASKLLDEEGVASERHLRSDRHHLFCRWVSRGLAVEPRFFSKPKARTRKANRQPARRRGRDAETI